MLGRPRMPPGQVRTNSWPILHAGAVPRELTPGTWSLRLHGEVEHPRTLSFGDLPALPQKEVGGDIHCVTSWSKLGMRWKGVPFSVLVDTVAPHSPALFVVIECGQGFTTSLPPDVLPEDEVLVAHTVDGGLLPPEQGGAGSHARP